MTDMTDTHCPTCGALVRIADGDSGSHYYVPVGYGSEYLQNVRRTLETGLDAAQSSPMEGVYIDLFTHALDELRRAGVEFPDTKGTTND